MYICMYIHFLHKGRPGDEEDDDDDEADINNKDNRLMVEPLIWSSAALQM